MKKWKQFALPVVLLVAAVYICVYSFFGYRSTVSAATMAEQPVTVVIDAGHGGEDGGTTSVSGVCESVINLQIAQKLEDFLAFCGVQTFMIRETDTAVYTGIGGTISEKKVSDLKNRVAMVNAQPNALLVSIHQNFFTQSKYHGAQVFYAKTDASKELAQRTQDAIRTSVDPENHREIKPSDAVYLMAHINCTGILVECGFLSNYEEDQKLQDGTYQKKLVAAIASAVTGAIREGVTNGEV